MQIYFLGIVVINDLYAYISGGDKHTPRDSISMDGEVLKRVISGPTIYVEAIPTSMLIVPQHPCFEELNLYALKPCTCLEKNIVYLC